MTRVKNKGLLYKVEKVRKYQLGGLSGSVPEYKRPASIGPVDPTGYHRDIAKRKAAEAGSGYIDKPDFNRGNNVFGAVDNSKNVGLTPPSPYVPKPDFGRGAVGVTPDASADAVTNPNTNTTTGTATPNLSGAGNVATQGIQMGAEALKNIDDGDERRYTNKEAAGDIAGSVLSGTATGITTGVALGAGTGAIATALGTMGAFTAMGSTVPVLGTIAGAVIGAVVAGFKFAKNKKKAKKAMKKYDVAETNQDIQKEKALLSEQDKLLAGAPAPTSQTPATAPMYGYRGYNKGGTFARLLLNKASENSALKK